MSLNLQISRPCNFLIIPPNQANSNIKPFNPNEKWFCFPNSIQTNANMITEGGEENLTQESKNLICFDQNGILVNLSSPWWNN